MQIKKLVSLPSRTGRHLQRYNQGYRLVVGCIPYRIRKTHKSSPYELEVLMISSQKSSRMMFPKGGWEIDEDIELAASRETLEEAGVIGSLGDKLGEWIFKSKRQDKFHEGSMFSLLVTEELDVWPEKNVRQRKWMTVDEARELGIIRFDLYKTVYGVNANSIIGFGPRFIQALISGNYMTTGV
ncbi:unnamed protein product [Fraxinus pennsylvanica]|uniref:Nudix hydrolase domain-containing protein n=1 Tax=Fraxinus pennsylvanica TaxID=56036 RepID=A0AAD2EA20_9LAMI|nr:unnamed protein product [Fraxinus pennsylvanica]